MSNNQIDYQAGLQWDEYGNPSPILDGGEMTMNNNQVHQSTWMLSYRVSVYT